MQDLNAEYTVFSKKYIPDTFIRSLKIDGNEVIGFRTETTSYSNGYRPTTSRQIFYTDHEKIISLGTPAHFGNGDYDNTYNKEDVEILNVMSYSDKQRMISYFNELIGLENMNAIEVKNKNVVHIFIANGIFNQVKCIEYIEHTGNEAAQAEYSYVSIVLSLGSRKTL